MKKYSKLMAILLVFAMILAGVAQAAPVVEAEEVNSNVIRLSGADRIKTSVKISQTAYKDGAESVVIVGYEGEVDALAGTLLAHAKKGPVLFTKKGKLSEDTKTEIARLGAKNVYILGGTATIEDAVKTELETLKYTVKRISGSNREGTAAAVAKEVGGKTTHVFLARGYGDLRAVLSDALAVGPASAKGNMAVLLTRTDKVPAATLKSMKDLGVTNVTIVGGEVAVNSGVKTELETLKYTVDRLSGTTREGTAIAIANKYFAGKANALVANGYGSPDALVGGYLGAAIDAPILFSQANKVSEVTTDYLKANTEKAWILGGERVVNKEVLNKVLGAVVPTPTPPSTGGGSGGGSGDNVAVSAISVEPKTMVLAEPGSTGVTTGSIIATVSPANATNKTVTWESSDEEVATVDSNGKVTAVATGTAIITAKAGNRTATTEVKVEEPQDITVVGNGFVNSSSYKGVFVEILLPGNDNDKIQSLKVDLFNANDELIGANTLKDAKKASGTGLTSPFVVIPEEDGYSSSSWDTTWVDGELSASNAPVKAVITAVDDNGVSYSAEAKYTGDWRSVWTQDIQVAGNGFKNSSTYKGVFVEISLPGTANDQIESLKVELFNDEGKLIGTNTLNSAATAHGAGLTSPFVVIPGDYTSKSWTTSWVDGEPSASNAPVKAVITAVDENSVSYAAEQTYNGDWSSIWPGEFSNNAVTTKAHNTVDGYLVDVRLTDGATFEDAEVTVSLYDEDGKLMQSNTLPENHDWTATSLTVPFDVRGSYDYANPAWGDGIKWEVEGSVKDNYNPPTKVEIQVTLANGKVIADTLTNVTPVVQDMLLIKMN